MPTQKLNAEIIHAAIDGFEFQKRRIDSQIDELRQLLSGGSTEHSAESEAPVHKRKISAAARRRMSAAQKARWAKAGAKGEASQPSAAAEAPKGKRRLSAAGRKAISEASKKRWALKRAVERKTQSTGPKRAPETAAKSRKPIKKTAAAAESAPAQ